ncbi:heavy-metal-associated domain-containing protein [Merismopedia glauca]|uniref:HMA domain-containing protein n=1 Tax=Merismopedia glauca CCAP 1448/3 TaxID=1296344 RepID=A0A2T1C0M4_9CYAN|nr:heavy-metal-associated domain-containing protein [Merismopedia glauca]PSB01673.1 hypothetical protein C7B64_17160 [Merismopedia glauca CCAP 1448/3]
MNLKLTIPSMACSACADTITKAVQNLDPDAKVQADLPTKIVDIETQSAETEVKSAIAAAGYPVKSKEKEGINPILND